MPEPTAPQVSLTTVAGQWTRLGLVGFGGPPVHIQLLRDLCVERQGWIEASEFEDAIAACNLLPGPASTQLAIYCARRVRGAAGAIVGGLGFILPGLVTILVPASLLLEPHPSRWILGAAAGGGAAVPAVAVAAGLLLLPASGARARTTTGPAFWWAARAAGAGVMALAGAWAALVLVGCGLIALVRLAPPHRHLATIWLAGTGAAAAGLGTVVALGWTALKVGVLSWGGGFVIILLMQADAVGHHRLTQTESLGAGALGQVTPGPVVQTVAVVGYGAGGGAGGIFASAIAFAPSFVFVLVGGYHFARVRTNARAQAFLAGAGPAAVGAILGAAIPLALALGVWWHAGLLAGAAVALAARRWVVAVIVAAAACGLVAVALGFRRPLTMTSAVASTGSRRRASGTRCGWRGRVRSGSVAAGSCAGAQGRARPPSAVSRVPSRAVPLGGR